MRRLVVCLLVCASFLMFFGPSAAAQNKLMRFADVHRDKIVFTYEGDLWLVSSSGGSAQRLTNHEGGEVFAKFSPDGTRLAFTAGYDGGTDVYVMDVAGGAPKRLTFHPGADYVQEWFPDGESILFRSRGRTYPSRDYSLWKVNTKGGMPERLPIDRGGLATISPDGSRIAYNRISREFATWKRYHGGMAMDIWICWLKEGHFEKITSYLGNDNWPMWIGGEIFFVSDESHTANLYKYSLGTGKISRVTEHTTYDVKYPSKGPGAVVYQNAGELYIFDVTLGESRKVPVHIPSDRVPVRATTFAVEDFLDGFGLSPTGVRAVFESRGDLFTVPVEEGTFRCLTAATSGSHEKNPAWSPDGRWVAFLSDLTGEEEVYIVDRKGDGDWTRLTSDGRGWRKQPVWSPDSKHLVFADKFMQLNLVDVKSRSARVIDRGTVDTGWEDWGVQEYSWSPDSKWVTYTKVVESQLESVFVYSLENNQVHAVTDNWRNDSSPSFTPCGKYLCFLSDRTFDPVMGELDQNHLYLDMAKPYVLILEEGEPSPFKAAETDEAVADTDEESSAEETAKSDGADEVVTRIDVDRFARRIVEVPVAPGDYYRLEAIDGGFLYLSKRDREFLKYQVVNDGTTSGFDLYKFDVASKKATLLMANIGNYHLSADRKKMIYRSGATLGVVKAGAKASAGDGRVSLARVFGQVNKAAEFLQIFNEAWRVQRDFFYDRAMHKVDWDGMGDKYRALVSYCGTRGDLNYLIGEMIGELNVGHTYIYGGDTSGPVSDAPRLRAALLGVDFDVDLAGGSESDDDYYRIAAVLPGDNADPAYRSPLYAPDCGVEDGDYLIAIDGKKVKRGDNVYERLLGKSGAIVTITYNSEPTAEGASDYCLKPIGSEMQLRYRRWVETCRAKVDEATEGQVAYMHVPDMGERGLVEFAKVYFSQHFKKGLIVDVRYNGGGFTADMMLDRLERTLWSLTKPREGNILRNPESVFYGPMATIVNQDTGSCGEYFATAFQVKKLGKVIGMRTWGGAVGIEPHQPLVDGGTTTPPQFAPYSPFTNKWYFEGWGVEPDIEIENWPSDVLKGKDAQLEKTIETVLAGMKEFYSEWDELPPPPDYPDKR